jgi:hypothetical protein
VPPVVAPPPATTAVATESVRSRIGAALGAAVLIAAIVVWSLGFGLLGGRITPLSVPLRG